MAWYMSVAPPATPMVRNNARRVTSAEPVLGKFFLRCPRAELVLKQCSHSAGAATVLQETEFVSAGEPRDAATQAPTDWLAGAAAGGAGRSGRERTDRAHAGNDPDLDVV